MPSLPTSPKPCSCSPCFPPSNPPFPDPSQEGVGRGESPSWMWCDSKVQELGHRSSLTTSLFPILIPTCSYLVSSSVSFLPHFHPLLPLLPHFTDYAISMAFLLWYILGAIFPPSLLSTLKPSLIAGCHSGNPGRVNTFYARLLPSLVPPSGRLLSAPASLSHSPASAPPWPPLTSPPLLLLGGCLALCASAGWCSRVSLASGTISHWAPETSRDRKSVV